MEGNQESLVQADTSILTNLLEEPRNNIQKAIEDAESKQQAIEAAKHPPKKVKRPKPKKLVVKTSRVGIYEIGYDGGGGTPKELGGEWTKMRMALTAIANYESRKAAERSGE